MNRVRISLPRPPAGAALRAAKSDLPTAIAGQVVAPQDVGPSAEEVAALAQNAQALQTQELLAQVIESVQELRSLHVQSLNELQQTAVELALAAASVVTERALAENHFGVDRLVETALRELGFERPVEVRLSAEDYCLLDDLTGKTQFEVLGEGVTVISDSSLKRGSCRTNGTRTTLTTDIQGRLDRIRKAWLENQDDTQIERRTNGADGGEVRRFPNRRETA